MLLVGTVLVLDALDLPEVTTRPAHVLGVTTRLPVSAQVSFQAESQCLKDTHLVIHQVSTTHERVNINLGRRSDGTV